MDPTCVDLTSHDGLIVAGALLAVRLATAALDRAPPEHAWAKKSASVIRRVVVGQHPAEKASK